MSEALICFMKFLVFRKTCMKLNFASPRRLSVCDKVSVSVKNQPMLFFSMHNHKIAPLALLDVNKNLIRIERKLHLLTNCTDSPSPAALPPEPLIPSFGCWEEEGVGGAGLWLKVSCESQEMQKSRKSTSC